MATVLTNSGLGVLTGRLKGLGTEPNWVGWGTGAGTAAKANTTLFTETGTRVQGTSTSSNGTYTVTAILVANSGTTITNAGLFNASSTGTLFIKTDFTGVVLAAGSGILFTFDLSSGTATFTVIGSSSPIVASPLTNGQSYTARARANYGTSGTPDWGPWSGSSSSFTPAATVNNYGNSFDPNTNFAGILTAASGPWTTPIPSSPVLDSNSTAMATSITTRTDTSGTERRVHYANFWNFGAPVYYVTNANAQITLSTTGVGNPATYNPLRWPTDVGATTPGADGWITVVDVDRGLAYTCWQAKRTGASTWTCSNVGFFTYPLTADGATALQGFGAGAGHCFGVGAITHKELMDGVIPHALFCQSFWAHSTFRYPASKSDGGQVSGTNIPEGSRFQLLPSYAYPGGYTPSAAIDAVITAMKTYGGYIVDVGDRNFSFTFRGEDLTDSSRVVPASGSNSGGDAGNGGRQNGVYWDQFGLTATGRTSDFFGELNYFGGTAWPSNLWTNAANFRFLASWDGS